MGVILNDWKHLLRTETSQKSLSKIFCYNNKVTRKAKDFQKLYNEEIYLRFQSNSAKYNKPFKFISWPNFLEGHHVLSPDIWSKSFTWFKKCFDGSLYFFYLVQTYLFFLSLKSLNTHNRHCTKYFDSQI